MLTKHAFVNLGTDDLVPDLVLERGKYIITDPCYVFPDEMWDSLCEEIFCNSDLTPTKNPNLTPTTGVIEMEGHKIWWGSTCYGDGCYGVYENGKPIGNIGVDAGMFAIFPIEFVKKYKLSLTEYSGLAVTVEMEGLVTYNNGNLMINNYPAITVITDGKDNQEEDE